MWNYQRVKTSFEQIWLDVPYRSEGKHRNIGKNQTERRWNLPFCGWLYSEVIPVISYSWDPFQDEQETHSSNTGALKKKHWRMLCPENSNDVFHIILTQPNSGVSPKKNEKTDLPRRFPRLMVRHKRVPWRFSVATVCAPSGRSRVSRRVQPSQIWFLDPEVLWDFHGFWASNIGFSWDLTITNMRI